jgi:hypothetical protein
MDQEDDVLERWRLVALVLNRVNPMALALFLQAAEVTVAETPEFFSFIRQTDFSC